MLRKKKAWLIYAVAVLLGLMLGGLVSWSDFYSSSTVVLIFIFFCGPLLFKWHHAILICFWNATCSAFFLPGSPDFWLICTGFSIGVSILNRVMTQRRFLSARPLTFAVTALAGVVLMTVSLRGGIGIRIFGGTSYGGRYYLLVLGAVVGYFALTSEGIPLLSAEKMAALFFISGATCALSNLTYILGPKFYFLYYLIPSEYALSEAQGDYGLTSAVRLQGLAPASLSILCFLLVRYGLRGLLDFAKPWRFLFLVLTIGLGALGGFRSILALSFLILTFQFFLERLFWTRLTLSIAGIGLAGVVCLCFFSRDAPKPVQRAISFLPVNVDPDVRADAVGSTEWREQMWKIVWKDVPQYLILGKGYSFDPTEMFLTTEAIRMGLLKSYEESLLAGDYHSGPLSVLVPFGIFGMAAFMSVLGAGFWVLYSNFCFGPAGLRRINTLLLSYYSSYVISFFLIFGAFNSQLCVFLGVLGFSVSVNHGVHRRSGEKSAIVRFTRVFKNEMPVS